MKTIIIGTSLSGKTTLVRYLRKNTDLNVEEIDEQLTALNGGSYPVNVDEKMLVLLPKVISKVLRESDIVFFTNTDYFSEADLINARKLHFKIVQLIIDKEELIRRNKERVKNEGYEDMSQWLEGMLEYQSKIFAAGLVDKMIEANQPIEKLAQEVLSYLNETRHHYVS